MNTHSLTMCMLACTALGRRCRSAEDVNSVVSRGQERIALEQRLQATLQALKERNAQLEAEVRELKQSTAPSSQQGASDAGVFAQKLAQVSVQLQARDIEGEIEGEIERDIEREIARACVCVSANVCLSSCVHAMNRLLLMRTAKRRQNDRRN